MSEQNKDAELLPCPHCNGGAEMRLYDGDYFVQCVECFASTAADHQDEHEAAEKWNRRSLPVGVPDVQITGHLDEVDAPVWEFINAEARKLGSLTGSIDSYNFARPNGSQPNGVVVVLWNGQKIHAIALTVRDAMNRTQCVRLIAAPTVKAKQGDCLYCHGHGEVTRTSGQTAESYSEHSEECPECKGAGVATSLPSAEPVAVIEYAGYDPANSIKWLNKGLQYMKPGTLLYAQAPSLPAAGLAVEEVEVVACIDLDTDAGTILYASRDDHWLDNALLMTVAQHNLIDGQRLEEIAQLHARVTVLDLKLRATPGGASYKALVAERDQLQDALSAQQSEPVTDKPSPLEVIGYASPGQIEILRELPRTGGMKVKGRKDDRYSEPVVLLSDARAAMISLAARCQQEGAFKTCLECGYQDGHDEICEFHASNRKPKQSEQDVSVPSGWRIVEKATCFALMEGNQVIATLAGPEAEENAAIIAALLNGGEA